MPFLKCKKCDHIDTHTRFTSRAGRKDLPPVCPKCFNDRRSIVNLGDEVSCAGCIYHTTIAGCCSNPQNTRGSDFWNWPQTRCYASRYAGGNGSSGQRTGDIQAIPAAAHPADPTRE